MQLLEIDAQDLSGCDLLLFIGFSAFWPKNAMASLCDPGNQGKQKANCAKVQQYPKHSEPNDFFP